LIIKKDALTLIESSSKYEHSLLVGRIMRVLAGLLSGDRGLWELIGILHDLDFDQTLDDRSKHGVVAANMLQGKLPGDALYAIMSHDYRTGLQPLSKMDHCLIYADSLAVFAEVGNLINPVTEAKLLDAFNKISEKKPWIKNIMDRFPFKDQVNTLGLLNIVL
jgi:predicted hydrolase (HD superfamily)